MLSNVDLIKQFTKHRNITEYGLSNQYEFAKKAHRFYSGDKGIYTAEITDDLSKRLIIFNKVQPYIDAVSGFMRQLRREPDYSARTDNDERQEELSAIYNAASSHYRDEANMDYYESAQDTEFLIAGYAVLDTNILYDENPDGRIAAELVCYKDVGWDPQARAPNLLDARWVFRRKKYSKEEALKRFKGSTEEDFPGVSDLDKQKMFNPFDGVYTAISIDSNTADEDLVEVWYYQWVELEKYYRANNPIWDLMENEAPEVVQRLITLLNLVKEKRSETLDQYAQEDVFAFDPTAPLLTMSPDIKGDVVEAFRQFGVVLEVQEYLKKCRYTAILTEKKVFRKFKSPDQHGYTLKFKTGHYDTEANVWYAMVRQLQEPARYANKALTEILYTIAYNSKGGVMYEKMAVDDPQRFEREYASTKAAIRVNDGALQQGMIQPKAQAALPTGYESVYEMSNQSMGEVTGINKEFLGSSENKQVSALLESQRINQVTSILAGYFDAISLYQLEHARLMMTYIRMLVQNRSRRINVEDARGRRWEEILTVDHFEIEYDLKIGEMPVSAVQKAQTGEILVNVAAQISATTGKDIYGIVIDYIPGIKYEDRKRIQQILNPEPTPEQIQQQQAIAEINIEAQKAKISKDISDATYKQASADKARAEVARTLGEAEQKNMENRLLKQLPVDKLSVVI